MRDFNRYILWDVIYDEKLGKDIKRPLNWRDGKKCDCTDEYFHTSLQQAEEAAEVWGKNVGFVICEEDPFFFVDIDDALDYDGRVRPDCQEVLDRFPGAFVETSQSNRGLHIIGRCDKSRLPEGRRCKAFKFDRSFDSVFTGKRFCALTNLDAHGDPDTDLTDEMVVFVNERLVDEIGTADVDWTDGPIEGAGLSDTDVIDRALASESTAGAFGHSVRFVDLWEGNAEALGKHFPDDHGERPYDASKADASLAQHLAFWTGGNCEQILRVMWMCPGLARDKWEARGDYYLPRTILRAVSRQSQFYRGGLSLVPPPPDEEEMPPLPEADPNLDIKSISEWADSFRMPETRLITGSRYMTAPEQVKYFAGCVYVGSVNRILTGDGRLLKTEAFKALYGGYRFELDSGKKSTTNALTAFTESQLVSHPKCVDMYFDPRLPAQAIVDDCVNTYLPPRITAREGDVSLLMLHLQKLFPVQSDREIILDYMAACVQMPGDKFQWCPMIQGTEGNGKSLIGTMLRNAVGFRHFHQQDPDDLANTFNSWIERAIIVCVEEIFVNNRHELTNRMKAMITNEYMPIQAKGQDQRSARNCAKFILFSNHRDGVYKHNSDRRYAVFYTAQQKKSDKFRDGLDSRYFHRLYGWVNSGEGKAALNWYLQHRKIQVDVMGEAPETSSQREAVFESLGPEERILLEAVDADEIGLRKGIMASCYVDNALREAGYKKVNPKKRNKILSNIGYAQVGKIMIGNRRMRLYADMNTPLATCGPDKIKKLYLQYNHSGQVSE